MKLASLMCNLSHLHFLSKMTKEFIKIIKSTDPQWALFHKSAKEPESENGETEEVREREHETETETQKQ